MLVMFEKWKQAVDSCQVFGVLLNLSTAFDCVLLRIKVQKSMNLIVHGNKFFWECLKVQS